MASDRPVSDTQEAPVGDAVVERVAERTGVTPEDIATALVLLHGELLGRHGAYERQFDYVTVDGTRAYRIDDQEWETLVADFEFGDELARAVQQAHREQAGLLFARTPGADDTFGDGESGVVISIDTAEQF